jgi:hypothetical protein
MTRLHLGPLRRTALWAVLIWSLSIPIVEAAPSISRTFAPFELGMPIGEFLAAVPADEIGAVGDARLFSVIGLRVNVTGIWCTFTQERLSRIEITFSVEYSSHTPWKEFLSSATREYGTGFHLPVPGGDVEMWDDGRTTLVLERRAVTARDLAYVVTLFDDAVAIEHGSRCAPRYSV